MIALQDEDEPKNMNDALMCPDKEKWIYAMEEEIESLKSNQIWELALPIVLCTHIVRRVYHRPLPFLTRSRLPPLAMPVEVLA